MPIGKITTVALAAFTLSACATAPLEHPVERSQVFSDNKDVVWERAVNFFAERNLSIKTIDRSSGIIAADRQISVPSEGIEGDADCGLDPLARRFLQTIDLNLFFRVLPNGSTSVTVNTLFTESRMLGYNYMTLKVVTCTSSGKLEQSVLAALGRQI